MKNTADVILSLDISSVNTGWAHWLHKPWLKGKKPERIKLVEYGCLESPGTIASRRLVLFESMLKTLLYRVSPTHVVLEDLNYTRNMDAVKTLGAFLGTAKKLCYEMHQREPALLSRPVVLKSVIGHGRVEKEDVIAFVNAQFGLKLPKTEKISEDVADAIVTGYCFILNKTGEENGQREE